MSGGDCDFKLVRVFIATSFSWNVDFRVERKIAVRVFLCHGSNTFLLAVPLSRISATANEVRIITSFWSTSHPICFSPEPYFCSILCWLLQVLWRSVQMSAKAACMVNLCLSSSHLFLLKHIVPKPIQQNAALKRSWRHEVFLWYLQPLRLQPLWSLQTQLQRVQPVWAKQPPRLSIRKSLHWSNCCNKEEALSLHFVPVFRIKR